MRLRTGTVVAAALAALLLAAALAAPSERAPAHPALAQGGSPETRWETYLAREHDVWPQRDVRTTTLAAGSFALDALAREVRIPLVAPEDVVASVVEVSFASGASVGFFLEVPDGCARGFGPLATGGQGSVVFDCGPLPAGQQELVLRHVSGAIAGTVSLRATYCEPHARCPPTDV